MKVIAIVVASFWLAGAAMAQSAGGTAGATCKTNADTSLHGAALSSSLKKCCREAAVGQKLHGAAERGFRKACEQAALGS
jgi:hypothetical protein